LTRWDSPTGGVVDEPGPFDGLPRRLVGILASFTEQAHVAPAAQLIGWFTDQCRDLVQRHCLPIHVPALPAVTRSEQRRSFDRTSAVTTRIATPQNDGHEDGRDLWPCGHRWRGRLAPPPSSGTARPHSGP